MSGEITIKAPVAVLMLTVLIVSLMINVWKFAQPSAAIAAPAAIGSTLPPMANPTGTPDPLTHVPRNPQDAVGMPDATGGRGNN